MSGTRCRRGIKECGCDARVMRRHGDEMTVKSRPYVLKHEYHFVFEVRSRSHGGQTITEMADGVEGQVVWAVIHCSQEDFIDIVG